MSNHPIQAEIASARAAIHGEYVSVTRVVDTLLDLRSLAIEDAAIVELIDQTLATMPGRSVVPNSWWLGSLDVIAEMHHGAGLHLDPLPG